MLSRRSFLQLASGLLVAAHEPVRAYSFVGGWAVTSASASPPSWASGGCILFYDPLRDTLRMRLLSSGKTVDFCEPAERDLMVQRLAPNRTPTVAGISGADYGRMVAALPRIGRPGSWADDEEVPI